MPIYEYRCSKCDSVFEKLQSFSASRSCSCPECHGEASRVISLGSFVLKGSGWYVTDHPSNTRKAGMSREPTTPSDPAKTKSDDTKPKEESKPKTDTTAAEPKS